MVETLPISNEGFQRTKAEKLAGLNLSNTLRYRDPPPGFEEVKTHAGAMTLFTMAYASASRLLTELNGISQAVDQGIFDRQAFAVTQRNIMQEINSDPVYLSAARFWKERGKKIPLVSTEDKEEIPKKEDKEFIFDRIVYTGSTGKILRLVTGATSAYQLSFRTIISLSDPTLLEIDDKTINAMALTLKRTIQLFRKNHPNYELHNVDELEGIKPIEITLGLQAKNPTEVTEQKLIETSGEHAIFSPVTESARRKLAFTLSRDQEFILFSYIERGGNDTASLVNDPNLQNSFKKLPEEIRDPWKNKWQQIADGNPSIVGVITAWNQALVWNIAKSYMPRDTDGKVIKDEDILSAGQEGLIKAINRFKLTRGTKFATFAQYHIVDRIQAEIRKRTGLTHRNMHELAKADRLYEVATSYIKRAPTPRELENLLLIFTDISPQAISRIFYNRDIRSQASLPFHLTDSQIARPRSYPAITKALNTLPPDQRKVVCEHIEFGRSVVEIAKINHTDPESIQALLDAGIRTLQTNVQLRKLRQEVDYSEVDRFLVAGYSLKQIKSRVNLSLPEITSRKKEIVEQRILTLKVYNRTARQRLREIAASEIPELVELVKSYFESNPLPTFKDVRTRKITR